MPTTATAPLQRLLASHSGQGSFTLSADVVKALADTAAIKRFPLNGALAANAIFFGTGDDNDAFDCRVYAEFPLVDSDESALFLLGTATCTLGANTGASGGSKIASTDRVVDTIVWTAASFATAAESAFSEGTSGAFSPADDTIAMLFLTSLGRASALIFEFDMTTGAPTGANVAVSRAVV